MDSESLRCFLCVAELGSFGRAAQNLNVSQPTLSRRIALLEHEIGVKLFLRHQRGVTLTPAGAALGGKARGIVRQLAELREGAALLGSGPAGSVSLGLPPSLCRVLGAPVVAEYAKRYPNVRLSVHEGVSDITEQKLATGELDLVVVMGERPRRGSSKMRPLAREDLVLVGRSPSLADRTSISVREMAELPLLLYPLPNHVRWQIDLAFRREGLTPDIVVEMDTLQMVAETARHGVGAAILPRSAVADMILSQALFAVPIRGLWVTWTMAISRERESASAVLAMASCIEEMAGRKIAEGAWAARRSPSA